MASPLVFAVALDIRILVGGDNQATPAAFAEAIRRTLQDMRDQGVAIARAEDGSDLFLVEDAIVHVTPQAAT